MIDFDFDPLELFEFLNEATEILEIIRCDETTPPSQKISFDQRADEAISKPASPADRRSSARKATALDKEFWESLG